MVNDLGVDQTPSIVVIDGKLKGRVLSGYVDRIAINQVIADARADSISPKISDSYLRDLNAICGQFETRANRVSYPTIRGKKPLSRSYRRAAKLIRTYRAKVAGLKTPAKYRTMEKRYVEVLKTCERRNQGAGQGRH